MVRLQMGLQKVRVGLMFRACIATAVLTVSLVPTLADDREVCASVASALRSLSASAQAFSDNAVGALPDNLEAASPSADLEQAAYSSAASSVPAPAADPVGAYAAALIRLRAPLEDYQRKLEAALVAAEACAVQP